VSEAGASGKLANATGGLFRGTEGRICALAGHRYSPLLVIKTTAWPGALPANAPIRLHVFRITVNGSSKRAGLERLVSKVREHIQNSRMKVEFFNGSID
jgi:hypothetical protein